MVFLFLFDNFLSTHIYIDGFFCILAHIFVLEYFDLIINNVLVVVGEMVLEFNLENY